MPRIASYEDVKTTREQRDFPGGHLAWRTNFMVPPKDVNDAPHAFLAESTPRRLLRTHFHNVDQFQVITSGGGLLGKHKLAIHTVHFSRAYTPYGPIVNGEEGLGFLTLRAQRDSGGQYLPEKREKLVQVPGRKPWQVSELPNFTGSQDVNVHAFSRIKDDHGLAAFALSLKPHATVTAPDPANTGGQYIITTKGSLTHQSKEYKAIAIAFVRANEAAWELVAGAEGLEALVLNYPRREPVTAKSVPTTKAPGYRVWQCALCSFTYDESKGMPEEGIAPGTRWEDVPETWLCPDCSSSKSDFELSVVAEPTQRGD